MPVYFIQQGETGPVKIGFAANVNKRVEQLKVASAAPLRLIGAVETGRENERYIHAIFERFRLRGEWFKPDGSIFEFIKKYNSYQYIQSPAQAGNGNQLGFDDLLLIHASPLPNEIEEVKEKRNPKKIEGDLTCICNKKFTPKNSVQKYCSPDCRALAHSKTFTCKSCGAEFLALSPRKYCTDKCRDEMADKELATCPFCGRPFHLRNTGHTFCTVICADLSRLVTKLRQQSYSDQDCKAKLIELINMS